MKSPRLLTPEPTRTGAFLLAAASLLCLLAAPAHAAPADLDTTFGTGEKVTTDFGSGFDIGQSVAVQSDGRIVVAGSSSNASANRDFALVRYTSTGALDTSFNGTGKVTKEFGGINDFGYGVAVQSDGKIVVAGYSDTSGIPDFALVRYTSTGALDTSFNGTGMVTTDFSGIDSSDVGRSVAVQSDGKIVVAGWSYGSQTDIALVRYTSTGALDTSFNGTGKVTTDFGQGLDAGESVAMQSDGKIVVAGYSSNASGNFDFALVRYTSTGALDTSFNGTGKVTTDFGSSYDYGQSVAVQSDGKIVVAGSFRIADRNGDFALVRYTSTGALDTSFNGTGKVTTDFGSGDNIRRSVAVQSDGKIVVAGSSSNASGNRDIALVRYTSTGALDTSFNGTGMVTTPIGSGNDYGSCVAVQSDGKIVVAGTSHNGSNLDFAVVRYEGDPVDPDLDDDGLLDSWEVAHFGTTAGQSALDDTDHDGRVELLELAFGADPHVSDPGATPAVINEGGYLTTTITKQPGVTYLVQSAARPDAAFSATSTTVLTNTATTLKVRDNIQVGAQPARFLRVKVTAVP